MGHNEEVQQNKKFDWIEQDDKTSLMILKYYFCKKCFTVASNVAVKVIENRLFSQK